MTNNSFLCGTEHTFPTSALLQTQSAQIKSRYHYTGTDSD
jgi:hypothetical protein